MAGTRSARSLRSDRNEDPLQKLHRGLQGIDLAVLESLPPPDSYDFKPSRRSGYATIELCLGSRPRIDGTPCEAWASIVTAERRDLQPPVVFYDKWQKSSAAGTRSIRCARSATSLLRKATELQPPFCFLPQDSVDEVKSARNMLCAIVLYQALVTGVETCALHWEQFGNSLSQALQYIHSGYAYHQWQQSSARAATGHNQPNGVSNAVEQARHDIVDVQDNESEDESRTAGTDSHGNFTGSLVRPERGVVARPNTSLARLKDELGDRKSKLLDQMPPLPMLIEPHNLGQLYFPFRMLIGSHTWQTGVPFKVYAYLEHDRTRNASMRFLGHDRTGHEQRFTMEELRGITLLQPLEYLNTLDKPGYADGGGSSARTAKVRSVISYYFFLAENKGWIGDPRVKIGEGFGKRLCAAIAEMQNAGFREDDTNINDSTMGNHEIETNGNVPVSKPLPAAVIKTASGTELAREEESDGRLSRMLRLNIQPESLRNISDRGPSSGRAQRTRSNTQNSRKGRSPRAASPAKFSAKALSNLQLRMRHSPRHSPRHSREVAGGRATARVDEIYAHRLSGHAVDVEVSDVVDQMSDKALHDGLLPSRNSNTKIGPTTANIPTEEGRFETNTSIVTPELLTRDNGDSTGRDATARMSLRERRVSALSAVDAEDCTDNDHLSMDTSTPSTVKSFSGAESSAESRSIADSIAHDPLINNHTANVRVAQFLDNRPPTPAGSAERDIKPQTVSTNVQDILRVERVVIDLCSDDEDISTQLGNPRTVIGQNPESKNGFDHLTRPFARFRGNKRKLSRLVYLSDSGDEAIEETDGNAHRQAQVRRRK